MRPLTLGGTPLDQIDFKRHIEPTLIEPAAQRLEELLDGLTPPQFAQLMGYKIQTMGNLLRRSNLPGFDLLWRLWQVKMVNPGWVLFGIEPKFLAEENTQAGNESTEDVILRLAASLPLDRRNALVRQILDLPIDLTP